MSKEQFLVMVSEFNEAITRTWPCPLSISIGYLFCPLTCGLSFLIPNLCIADSEKNLRTRMEYYNKYRLQDRGLSLRLVKRCTTSWIELRIEETVEDDIELGPVPSKIRSASTPDEDDRKGLVLDESSELDRTGEASSAEGEPRPLSFQSLVESARSQTEKEDSESSGDLLKE